MQPSFDRHRATPPASIAAADGAIDWPALEAVVHVDPAGRGLASYRRALAPLDAGQLRASALHIARHAQSVGIVTGFCVISDDGVTAETDGPPGALFLARALLALGIEVCLISDSYALPLLEYGCDLWKLDRGLLVEIPFEAGPPASVARQRNDRGNNAKTDCWVRDFFASPRARSLTHVVSVERPGPSHTLESLEAHLQSAPAVLEQFAAAVPAEHRDICHSMRGEPINAHTAKTHRLFDVIADQSRSITTIGVGDGGNEIGMGRFDWPSLVEAIGSHGAERIVCRIATDFAIIAGVSNWAAYALALAVVRLRGTVDLGQDWDARGQRRLIEGMVREARAVDGLTRRREPTVDGLPLDEYSRPLDEMRKLLGYAGKP